MKYIRYLTKIIARGELEITLFVDPRDQNSNVGSSKAARVKICLMKTKD